jgi:hypothetical protein
MKGQLLFLEVGGRLLFAADFGYLRMFTGVCLCLDACIEISAKRRDTLASAWLRLTVGAYWCRNTCIAARYT